MGLTSKPQSDILQLDLEKRLIRAMENRKKALARWDKTIAELTKLVTPNCTHPDIREYRWEADDGYGHQSKMIGLECGLCFARKPYKIMGQWIKAKDFSYD